MKKIIIFGIMLLLVFSLTVEPAQAGWFEDTWNWLIDFLGIGEEEAKEIALEMIGNSFNRNINPDGSYTIQIWGGIRNIKENGKWKRIEEVISLKPALDEGLIKLKYLKDDKLHDFEIVDLNYTSLKVKPILKDSKELNKDIPLKLDGKIKDNVKLKTLKGDNYNFIMDNIFKHNYTFGFNSTTITIVTNSTSSGLIDDASVKQAGTGNENAGSKVDFQSYWNIGTSFRAYFRFDITDIPSGQTVTDATLGLWKWYDFGEAVMGLHEVYNNTWTEGADTDWTDRSGQNSDVGIHWNNQPCGTTQQSSNMDSVQCNLTADSSTVISATTSVWTVYSASGVVASHHNQGRDNTTFVLVTVETGDAQGSQYYTKEHGTVAIRPYLNVTYEIPYVNARPGFEPISNIEKNEDFSNFIMDISANISDNLDSDADIVIEFSINESGLFSIDINNVTDEINFTNAVANQSGTRRLNLTIWDTEGEQNSSTFDVIINAINDQPWKEGTISNITSTEDVGIITVVTNADLKANFSDVEENNNPTTYELISQTNTTVECYFDSNILKCDSVLNQFGESNIKFSLNDSGGLSIEYDLNITLASANDAPSNPTPLVNSTTIEQTNLTNETLSCNFLCSDPDTSDTLTYDIYWFKDGVSQFSFLTQSCSSDPVFVSEELTSGNTSVGDLWSCSINITDVGGLSSSTVFSNNITITNYAPTPINILFNSTTTEQTNLTNETLQLTFTFQDALDLEGGTWDVAFYKDNVEQFFLEGSSTNNEQIIINLESGNTTREEIWFAKINITDDSGGSSSNINSNNITIENYDPYNIQVVPPSLANATETPNLTITFNCSAEDLDNDILYYEYYSDTNKPPNTLIGNVTTEYNHTFTLDNFQWWRCRAVDVYGGHSDWSESRYLNIDNSTIKNYTANFSATTTEGTIERFEFNVSYNPIQLNYVDAKLIYQNVHYSLIQNNLTDALTRFYLDLTIPTVSADPTTTEFYLNVTDTYINGSIGYEISGNYTQSVNKVDIFECDGITNSTQALAYNFTFWDETNNSKVSYVENITGASFEANFLIWKDDKSINDTLLFDVDNKTEIDICISPVDESYNVDAVIEYNLNNYDKRFYYLPEATLNNATQNISLYLLLTSKADDIILSIQDSGGSPQVGALIYAQRYYTGLDAYTAVAMGRTNDDGEDTIPLRKIDTIYRFIIKQEGTTTFTSYPAKIIEDELTFTVDPETLYDIINEFEDVDYSLTWSNDSRNVVLTYSTDSGLSRNFCLRVIKLTTSGDSIKYDNCLSSASGTITAKINETGQYNAIFYGKGDIQHTISKLNIIIGVVGRFVNEVGLSGIFYLILINGVLVGMGIAMGNAIFALLAPLIGTIFLTIFGIVNITWAMIVGIAFVIIITITLLKER